MLLDILRPQSGGSGGGTYHAGLAHLRQYVTCHDSSELPYYAALHHAVQVLLPAPFWFPAPLPTGDDPTYKGGRLFDKAV
jgi:hypothetical protein